MTEDKTSYHHLYYSAHADPVQELEKLTQVPSKEDTPSFPDR